MVDYKGEVQKALENIKDVFSKYKVRHPVEGSPISVSEEMQYKLEHDTYNTLPRYCFHAMNTWGSADDFKSLLPIMLKIYTFDNSLFSMSGLFGKIERAKLDEQEQESIHVYCIALWNYILANFKEYEWDIGYFVQNTFYTEEYLIIWKSRLHEISAFQHLVAFINYTYGAMIWGLWTIDANDNYDNWIVSEAMLKRLEAAYFQYMDEPFGQEISMAVENIKWLLWYNKFEEE